MGDTDDYAYLMVVMIKRHDDKVDGWSWFKAIRGREKRDTEVWMLISINAIDDDEDSRSHESKVDGWMGLKPARGRKERDSVILIIMQI